MTAQPSDRATPATLQSVEYKQAPEQIHRPILVTAKAGALPDYSIDLGQFTGVPTCLLSGHAECLPLQQGIISQT